MKYLDELVKESKESIKLLSGSPIKGVTKLVQSEALIISKARLYVALLAKEAPEELEFVYKDNIKIILSNPNLPRDVYLNAYETSRMCKGLIEKLNL